MNVVSYNRLQSLKFSQRSCLSSSILGYNARYCLTLNR